MLFLIMILAVAALLRSLDLITALFILGLLGEHILRFLAIVRLTEPALLPLAFLDAPRPLRIASAVEGGTLLVGMLVAFIGSNSRGSGEGLAFLMVALVGVYLVARSLEALHLGRLNDDLMRAIGRPTTIGASTGGITCATGCILAGCIMSIVVTLGTRSESSPIGVGLAVVAALATLFLVVLVLWMAILLSINAQRLRRSASAMGSTG